jgi:charged multivesicular body protein 3
LLQVFDEDGMEEETEAEVDKILSELAGETMVKLPTTDAGSYKAAQAAREAAQTEDPDMAALQERLNTVRMGA